MGSGWIFVDAREWGGVVLGFGKGRHDLSVLLCGTYLDLVGGKMDMCRAFAACLPSSTLSYGADTYQPPHNIGIPVPQKLCKPPSPSSRPRPFQPQYPASLAFPSLLFLCLQIQRSYLHWPSEALLYVL